jgi:predicted 3-demethylubiquinone-9 3-methyltransferase (glyoxalase superfamily)
MATTTTTVIWFNGHGREAAEFYCTLVPGSRVTRVFEGENGMGRFAVIDFTLGGHPYQILDAGPAFPLSEAVSIALETDDQAEADRLWHALQEGGGSPSACGWLKDRYGMSWQVYPRRLTELTLHPDPAISQPAMAEMMTQGRIDIAAIEAAVAKAAA